MAVPVLVAIQYFSVADGSGADGRLREQSADNALDAFDSHRVHEL